MRVTFFGCVKVDLRICKSDSGPGIDTSSWDLRYDPDESDVELVDREEWEAVMASVWGEPTRENMLDAVLNAPMDDWIDAVEQESKR